ncbi:MAG: sulfurtransferase-like selenium metabolism protein YedF [Thermodesulfovibrionales bacterium]|nr:sulfurtransferase-like selenium metabolism protein YedF [Thermodesulfovibrionales bacterium]
MEIDARGHGCPKPVIMAEEALSKIAEGIVMILVDNEASVSNLSRFASKSGFYSETSMEGNYWRVKIVKGYPCETKSQESGVKSQESEGKRQFKEDAKETDKDLLLIIGTDTMGKVEELGKILMKGFFETMKVTKEIPHTIFFLNAGVKLTTSNEEVIPILKEIEAMGVEIFSCGTCLKYYNLESELKVGYRGATSHIVEGIKDFQKVVWI